MSESRWRAILPRLNLPAAASLLVLGGCAAPQQTAGYSGPPSLQVAPPSYYSRTPYYRRTVIPARPGKGNRKGTPETVIIEREVVPVYSGDGNGGEPPAAKRERANSSIDEAERSLREMQGNLREQYRQMSPEVEK